MIITRNNYKTFLSDFRYNKRLNRGLILTLDSERYGFKPDEHSSVFITVDAYCTLTDNDSGECDAWFSFSIGNTQYFNFITDADGSLELYTGIFSNYPGCRLSNPVADGDASTLLSSMSLQDFNETGIRNVLSNGNESNYDTLMEESRIQPNGRRYFPLKFELHNYPLQNKFVFGFETPAFDAYNLGPTFRCQYNSAVNAEQDFKMFMSPDGGNEEIRIKSIKVSRCDYL